MFKTLQHKQYFLLHKTLYTSAKKNQQSETKYTLHLIFYDFLQMTWKTKKIF